MKNKILVLLLCLGTFAGFSQGKKFQNLGGSYSPGQQAEGLKAKKILVAPSFSELPIYPVTFGGDSTRGALAMVTTDSSFYYFTGYQWLPFDKYASHQGTRFEGQPIITWVAGLTYHVFVPRYWFNGVEKHPIDTTITLPTAPVTQKRIDVIAANSSNQVVLHPGDSSVSPIKQSVDGTTELEAGSINVNPGMVAPSDIRMEWVYRSGIEWDTISNLFGASPVRFRSTVQPFEGLYNIKTGCYTSGRISFAAHTPAIVDSFQTLMVHLKLYGLIGGGLNVTGYYNSVRVAPTFNLFNGNFGFEPLDTSWQTLYIPISRFGGAERIDKLMFGVNDSSCTGWQMDDIGFQGNAAIIETPDKYIIGLRGDTGIYNAPNNTAVPNVTGAGGISIWANEHGLVVDGSGVSGGGGGGANNYPTSLSFNSGTGVLTQGRNALSDLTASFDGRYLPSTDTAAMLLAYLRKNDTTAMLLPYLRKVDTTAMLLAYLRKNDTTAMLLPYLRKTDTTAMLLPYLRKADSTAMLLAYLRKNDTTAMLLPYLRKMDSTAMLLPYLRKYLVAGGSTNQVLKKNSGTDYDFSWSTPTSGIGGTLNNSRIVFSDNGAVKDTAIFSYDRANAAVGIGTASPNGSSILDLTSSNKGFLLPRMSNANMLAIVNPGLGLQIFSNTDSVSYYYNGIGWTGNAMYYSGSNYYTAKAGLGGSGNNNLLIGLRAGKNLNGNSDVIAFGTDALSSITYDVLSGDASIGIGTNALKLWTTNAGSLGPNLAIGNNALATIVTGTGSVAIGSNALAVTTVGGNTAVGARALAALTTGSGTAIGQGAARSLTTGSGVFIGATAAQTMTTGAGLIAIGSRTLEGAVITASNMIAIGGSSGRANAGNTISIGSNTGSGNSGQFSIAIGDFALGLRTVAASDKVSTNSIAIGYRSQGNVDSGANNNVTVGFQTNYSDNNLGHTKFTGVRNIVIGSALSQRDTTGAGASNSITFGANGLRQLEFYNNSFIVNTTGSNVTNEPSAALNVPSTNKGFLPPRMTAIQAEAISSKAEGLLVYATNGTGAVITSKGWWGWNGTTWEKFN